MSNLWAEFCKPRYVNELMQEFDQDVVEHYVKVEVKARKWLEKLFKQPERKNND